MKAEKARRSAPSGIRSLLWALLCLLLCVSPVLAEDEDLRLLELYNGGTVELVSIDRSPRPASQTAENITVITAKEIQALNAHTLPEVLNAVTGVQIENLRTPGSFVYLHVQGSKANHILVMIDNVPINILAENMADIGSVPVQMIDRIEIVKGAASSSWGSALGGVINIITKSPLSERSVGGMVSTSLGEKETVDGRAEITGTLDRFGYYLTAGRLRSDGLVRYNDIELNSFYGKLTYDLPVRGSLTLTTGLTSNESGLMAYDFQMPQTGDAWHTSEADEDNRQLIASLTLQYPLADRLDLQGMLRGRVSEFNIYNRFSFTPDVTQMGTDESSVGASVILSWVGSIQRVVGGVDYDYVEAELTQPQQLADDLEPSAHRVGVYLNDTITLGDFAVTPSARFDHTGTGDNLFSPSFGVTYALTENSVLRGYTARGYSITSINRDNSTEKVWTSQVGFETADIPYLWFKGTVFRNDTWDVAVPMMTPQGPTILKQSMLKQGYELELRTTPFWHTSFSLGYIFIKATNEDTDTVIRGVPRHTLNMAVKYEDNRQLRAMLHGHYIDWNGSGGPADGDYSSVIWDLHLGKKFELGLDTSLELFGSVRNLFNGSQYLYPFTNPSRWVEVGVRCEF